jgi:Ca2+-binding RTX toxin-like protein
MRTSLALAVLAMLAAGLPAPAAAHAAAVCQGKPATIVDLDGGDVQGTSGDDVIYAEGNSTIAGMAGNDTICFVEGSGFGGPGADSVQVAGSTVGRFLDIRDAENLDITIGSGGGSLQLVNIRAGAGTVDASGGVHLSLIGKKTVAVDLEDDLMTLDSGTYALLGNPGIFAIARKVELVGDRADNNLAVNQYSCRITMKGGRGHDELTVAGSDGDLPFPENCGSWPSKVYGQRGNDLLQGRGGPDVLIGGPGRDQARGGFGTDTCKAERERNCER